MEIILGIALFIGLIYLVSIPFGVLSKAFESVFHLSDTQRVVMLFSIILFFVLLTLMIGIIDIIRCKRAAKHNGLRKLRDENQSLGREVEALRAREQQMDAEEQECSRAAAAEYSRSKAQMERNVRVLRYAVRRNKLCELLSAAGSRQADQMIIRDSRGENIRKQQEQLLAGYDELRRRFERS